MIDSLEKMEEIVESNPYLKWEGWDVLWYKPYPAGFLKRDGAFFNGKWTRVVRISPNRGGWKLPRSLLRGT